ncbi:MAG: lipoyl protein ligase domain-containing protein [Acidimicrobiia bacterium]
MTDSGLFVVRDQLSGDAALDTATSRAILQRATNGELPEILQIGFPHRVMAFGKHDTLSNGFERAVELAVSHGYEPTVRIAGGRAVVFSPTILRFAWTMATDEPAKKMRARFSMLSDAVVASLAALGVAGEIGEVPNEYCAGEYSVHVLGSRKVMGVGQRLSRSAAQIGGMIVVSDPDDINEVLVPVYAALGVPMDPNATGSVADVTQVSPDDLADSLIASIAAGRSIMPTIIDGETLDLAGTLRAKHVPSFA